MASTSVRLLALLVLMRFYALLFAAAIGPAVRAQNSRVRLRRPACSRTARPSPRAGGRGHELKFSLSIRVTTQSAQSPDFNGNGLSFFYSPQCDVRVQSMGIRFGLIKAVKRFHAEYPAGKIVACWRSLVT